MTLPFLLARIHPQHEAIRETDDIVAKWVLHYSAWPEERIRQRIAELDGEHDAEHFMKWKWSPSLATLRRLGIRPRQEINDELYALRTLRGDFRGLEHMTRARSALATAARYA